MKGQVTAVVLDEADRTADLTITVTSDSGVPLSTDIVLVPLDIFTTKLVTDKIKDLLQREILALEPLPLTQQQVEDQVLNLVVIEPGGPP